MVPSVDSTFADCTRYAAIMPEQSPPWEARGCPCRAGRGVSTRSSTPAEVPVRFTVERQLSVLIPGGHLEVVGQRRGIQSASLSVGPESQQAVVACWCQLLRWRSIGVHVPQGARSSSTRSSWKRRTRREWHQSQCEPDATPIAMRCSCGAPDPSDAVCPPITKALDPRHAPASLDSPTGRLRD